MNNKDKELILSFVRLLEFERDEMGIYDKVKSILDNTYAEYYESSNDVAEEILNIVSVDYRQLYRDFVLGKTSKMQ